MDREHKRRLRALNAQPKQCTTCKSREITFEYSGHDGCVAATWAVCPGCAKTASSARGHDEIGALENWNRDN